jgi:hypothetical protein
MPAALLRGAGGFFLSALFGAVVRAPNRVQNPGPSEADFQRMREHFGAGLEKNLPHNKAQGVYVAYRPYRDLYTDQLELDLPPGRSTR